MAPHQQHVVMIELGRLLRSCIGPYDSRKKAEFDAATWNGKHHRDHMVRAYVLPIRPAYNANFDEAERIAELETHHA